ncbi:MAG: hypothetical protein AAFR51_04015 [Pseudomonadota bacterium]
MAAPHLKRAVFVGTLFTLLPLASAQLERSENVTSNIDTTLPQCRQLVTVSSGITLSARGSASKISDDDKGLLVISAIAGGDLGQNPNHLTKLFRSKGLRADCVVSAEVHPSSGSSYSFHVAGLVIVTGGESSWSAQELRDNPEILRSAAAEANIADIILNLE